MRVTSGQTPEHQFQSTLPLRGATGAVDFRITGFNISIHTPLAGSDLTRMAQ